LEHRGLGIGVVEMDRVVVARDCGEGVDIGDRHRALIGRAHARLERVDRIALRSLIGHVAPRREIARNLTERAPRRQGMELGLSPQKPRRYSLARDTLLPAFRGIPFWRTTA